MSLSASFSLHRYTAFDIVVVSEKVTVLLVVELDARCFGGQPYLQSTLPVKVLTMGLFK